MIALLLSLEEGGQMVGTELVQAILVILGLFLLLLLICLPGIVGGLEAIAVKVAVGFDKIPPFPAGNGSVCFPVLALPFVRSV